MKTAFKDYGAFPPIIALIATLDRSTDSQTDELTFCFIIELLEIMASALRNTKANQEYFKAQRLYSSLSKALHNSHFGREVKYFVRFHRTHRG